VEVSKMKKLSRNRRRSDSGAAFLPDPRARSVRAPDDLAEALAEEYVWSVTSAEQGEELHDPTLDEELGGPFVITPASRQFARGIDASNPRGAERAPFPQAMGSAED
jgi:hypothetical protein